MGKASTKAVVLDAGALIAFERGSEKMRALCRQGLRAGVSFVIPAGVVAQVYRDGARQVGLCGLLNGPTSRVVPLDKTLAEAAGVLCGRTGVSDVVDASVVLVARREHAVVVSGDVADLRLLDPALPIERI
jgi:hypothetical protein